MEIIRMVFFCYEILCAGIRLGPGFLCTISRNPVPLGAVGHRCHDFKKRNLRFSSGWVQQGFVRNLESTDFRYQGSVGYR